MTTKTDAVANAIRDVLISPNESDRNLEPANVVDGLFAIARALEGVAVHISAMAMPPRQWALSKRSVCTSARSWIALPKL